MALRWTFVFRLSLFSVAIPVALGSPRPPYARRTWQSAPQEHARCGGGTRLLPKLARARCVLSRMHIFTMSSLISDARALKGSHACLRLKRLCNFRTHQNVKTLAASGNATLQVLGPLLKFVGLASGIKMGNAKRVNGRPLGNIHRLLSANHRQAIHKTISSEPLVYQAIS